MRRFRVLTAVLALTLTGLAGCVDDEGPATPPELDEAFIGYSNVQTGQTTCGNCHIGKQRDWQATAHAGAWSTLQASGQAQAFCERCHTTSGFANTGPDSAGYFAVSGAAKDFYKDVQCEACHGPGAAHVSVPDAVQPLTTIVADTGATIGCAACHSGTHQPFVEEWRSSAHAIRNSYNNANPSCMGCHEGSTALRRLDPQAKFVEMNGSAGPQAITCAVCHDPHGGPNSGQLRMPINTPSLETNLCMNCHARRFAPDPASSRGAHTPQGPMLLGEAGWVPPDFAYDPQLGSSSHGTDANPRLCAGCHVEQFTVTDAATGAFVINATGHRFLAVPCVDANGAPTGQMNCPDTERRFNACVSGGCHVSSGIVLNLRNVLRNRLQVNYIDVLWKDIDADGVLDAFPADSGLLARVKATTPGDFSATGTGATIITVGEGVWFNADMIKRADGSWGVHNPFYAEALLLSSLQALRAKYTYLPAPPAGLQAQYVARAQALGMNRRR